MDKLHLAERSAHGGFRTETPHPTWLFLREMLRDPLHVAAVKPSGAHLARAMLAALPQPLDGLRVVELGGGTGVFTRAMLAAGIKRENLLVIERNRALHSYLARELPGVAVAQGEAEAMGEIAAACGFEAPFDAVVSGLPMASMRVPTKTRILEAGFALLGEGGRFVQFTYGVRAPISELALAGLGLRARRAGVALLNLPPATVHRIERRSARI